MANRILYLVCTYVGDIPTYMGMYTPVFYEIWSACFTSPKPTTTIDIFFKWIHLKSALQCICLSTFRTEAVAVTSIAS
jgi:hypothetical protein